MQDADLEKRIIDQALGITNAAEREALLQKACGHDAALLQRIRAFLQANEATMAVPSNEAAAKFAAQWEFPSESPGTLIGRYKLLERVGEGGCGVVYMAEQKEPVHRRVALKVIKLGMDTQQVVARFEAERQALALMDHPNIARVLDAGATELGRPYFVMELVRGIPITHYCDQNNLSPAARLGLFIKVCQAIQHAHQKGIIHRDIKPSNILVTVNNGAPEPKVIDFGIAKATEGRLSDHTVYTQLHQVIGTPAYMSPEQAEMTSLDIDTRSDIYSLGVLLYELLSGKTPFDARQLTQAGLDMMRKIIREQDPPRPSTRLATLQDKELSDTARRRSTEAPKLVRQLEGDLDWIVMKCLEKDRQLRYETANGLAADITRHLANQPVIARPPTIGYTFQKAFHRNRLLFTACAAVAAALVAGITVSSWQMIRATRAEQEQNKLRVIAVNALDGEKTQRVQAENERQRAEANAERFKNASIQSRRSQYASDMFVTTTEMEKGNYVKARGFLREYFPREGLEELRGFEWRYAWESSAGQQLKIFPVTGRILDTAWSPDGRLLAIGGSGGAVKLLDAETGAMSSVLTNGLNEYYSVSFSFDGNGLAAASDTGVRLWNVRDGRLIFTVTNDRPRVACSPAGPLMAIGTGGDWWGQSGADVHLVDMRSGLETRVLPKAGDRSVFSPDGKRLASANWGDSTSGSQAVILWDVDSGQKLGVLPNKRRVLGMAISPDGSLLAIGTMKGEITLWNLHDFSETVLRKPTEDVARALAFSPDGRWLAVGMQTQEVEIWDVLEQQQIKRLRGHTSEITAVAFSPNGTQLASGCNDGTVRLWDPRPPTVQKLIPEAHLSEYFWVGNPEFSPDNRWVAAAVKNGDVQIVDPATTDWTVRMALPNAGLPIAFSSDAATLLTLSSNFTLRRWNVPSGEMLSTTSLNATNAPWRVAATTPDGSRLALATFNLVEVFETRTGICLAHFNSPLEPNNVEFLPDGKSLAFAGHRIGAFWDIATGHFVRVFRGHDSQVSAMRLSPDQKMIATASWDDTARLWDAATGKELAVLRGHKAGVLNCVFSPDGRTLVTGSDDRTIKFWSLATFREVASFPVSAPAYYLAFSPDGQILTANAKGGGLQCWRAPSLAMIDAAEAKEKTEIKQP